MRLTELNPQFLKCGKAIAEKWHGRKLADGTTQWGGFEVEVFNHVETLAEADMMSMLCPKCFRDNKGSVGTHSVIVWFEGRHAPKEHNKGVRWKVKGTGYADLSTTPSILFLDGCKWHGYVTAGEVSII